MDTPGDERRNGVEKKVKKLKEKMNTIVKIWKDQNDIKNHLKRMSEFILHSSTLII